MARAILQLGAGARTADVQASALSVAGVTDAVQASQADAVIVTVESLSQQRRRELANLPGVEAVFDDIQGLPLVADRDEIEDFLEGVRQRRDGDDAPLLFETEPTTGDGDGRPMPDGGAITLPIPQSESGPLPLSRGPIDSASAAVEWTGAKALHDEGITGESTIAVVIDTGSCRSAFREDRQLDGIDFTGDDDPWTPMTGHGGMTMGIMAGDERTPGIDVGFLPDADLFPIKTTLAASELMQAQDIIVRLAERNPDKTVVVNNSWGFPECSGICGHPITSAIRSASTHQRVVQVFAAGNEGGSDAVTTCGGECDGSTVGISGPNSINEVVTVAATGRDGVPDEIQSYSSRGGPGTVSCGQHKPDVAAPTFGTMPYACSERQMGNNGGTSAACPQVAGAIGLIADAKGRVTTTTVSRGLAETAAPVPPNNDTFDGCSGAGNIQVDAATNVTPEGGEEPEIVEAGLGDTVGVIGAAAGLSALAAAAVRHQTGR